MNDKVTKLSRCAILSALAFGIIAIHYVTGNPDFAQVLKSITRSDG